MTRAVPKEEREKIVLSHPDATLENYREQFYNKTGIEVTIVTMHNACKALNLNRKKRVIETSEVSYKG